MVLQRFPPDDQQVSTNGFHAALDGMSEISVGGGNDVRHFAHASLEIGRIGGSEIGYFKNHKNSKIGVVRHYPETQVLAPKKVTVLN